MYIPYNPYMLTYHDLRGAIFDVDDTLLSNYPDDTGVGLHEQSRLRAIHEVGRRHNLPALQVFTIQQSTEAFLDAKVHTLHAAVWRMLYMAGEVDNEDDINPNHPLLCEIVDLKEELHEDVLRTYGKEVPGAITFVQALAQSGLAGKLAVASTSSRRDIDLFFGMTGLDKVFSDEHIISRERFTHAKPHPECFNMAFDTLGLPESARMQVAAFEDDPRGIMAAKAAGLFTFAVTTRYSREQLAALEIAPDVIAQDFHELAQILQVPA